MDALSAADVAVLPNINNEFSRYCFPTSLLNTWQHTSNCCNKSGDDLQSFQSTISCASPTTKRWQKLIYALKSSKKPDYRNAQKADMAESCKNWTIQSGTS